MITLFSVNDDSFISATRRVYDWNSARPADDFNIAWMISIMCFPCLQYISSIFPIQDMDELILK